MSWTQQERRDAAQRVLEEIGPMIRALRHATELPEDSAARQSALDWKSQLLELVELLASQPPR